MIRPLLLSLKIILHRDATQHKSRKTNSIELRSNKILNDTHTMTN
uniref:Uncharacterized protein n=1 Tax=Rhizophora mucronata TaxID=61149 RepID=A0A2P2L9M4_RHIMU